MHVIDFLYGSCIVSVFIVIMIDVAQSVPPDYCLHTLNTSDCSGPPIRVAYYYKPGSRCEIATWLGCPTLNMFNDEVLCSHVCIARIIPWPDDNKFGQHLNLKIASKEADQDDMAAWEQDIENASEEDLELMEDILDNAVESHSQEGKKKLKFLQDYSVESTTPSDTHKAETEETAEEIPDKNIPDEEIPDVEVTTVIEDTTESVTEAKEETTTTTTTTTVPTTTVDNDSGTPEEFLVP